MPAARANTQDPAARANTSDKVIMNMNPRIVRSSLQEPTRNSQPRALKIAIVSTFPPRACGLATFARDLFDSLSSAGCAVSVVAVDRNSKAPNSGDSDPGVTTRICDSDPASYVAAAEVVNEAFDVVVIQHEFGIYGGADGEHLLAFTSQLTVPYIVTLHTVLPQFSLNQLAVLRSVCARAAIVNVFTPTAHDLLVQQKVISGELVVVVPHGVPTAIYDVNAEAARHRLNLEGCFVMSSFGLVSEGKGLELAIASLPIVVQQIPTAHLVVAGRTHPDIFAREGETYRTRLVELADQLGVGDRVTFIDEFLTVERVAEVLAATDVFVTPYTNMDQIVSGALTFAVAAGCPVVSTKYSYAVDLLQQGAGILLADRNVPSFSAAICELAATDSQSVAQARSRVIGEQMRWSVIGERMAAMARDAIGGERSPEVVPSAPQRVITSTQSETWQPSTKYLGPTHTLPPVRHLRRLVDDRGIIQHATGVVPLLSSGYCVDDIARLIPVSRSLCDAASHGHRSDEWERVFTRSIGVLAASHQPGSALMRNFFDWSGSWLDTPHFGDHVGRALMGLAATPNHSEYSTVVAPLFADVLSAWPMDSPNHPMAYALVAQASAPHLARFDVANTMLQRLLTTFRETSTPSWKWLEPSVRYDQGRFPQALLLGGKLLRNDEAIDCGLTMLSWWTSKCDHGSYLRFPGHRGWSNTYPLGWSGDEQPLEALSFVEAHEAAYQVTGQRSHAEAVERGMQWFYGANRLALRLGDLNSGACFDGLGSFDVNANCGAESTLALFQAHLCYARLQKSFHPAVAPVSARVRLPLVEVPCLAPELAGT